MNGNIAYCTQRQPKNTNRDNPMAYTLKNKEVSSDDAMKKVIAAQAKIAELKDELRAVKADNKDLLSEYTDMVKARPVKKIPKKKRAKIKAEFVRVCAGDVHGMMMDRAAVEAFLADVKVLNPDQIVLGGDIVECGGWLAKHHADRYIALTNYSYQEDIAAGNWFLDELQKAAPSAEIIYIEGNHCERVEVWAIDQVQSRRRDAEFLYEAFSPESLLRLKERGIKYYRRGVNHVPGLPNGWIKLGKMFFTHTLGTSANAARQAVIKTAGNVTFWHTHREDSATVVLPGVGIVKAFNPGCLCTLQPVWRNSDPTSWSHGYGIDFIAPSENFQRIHVPIWNGETLAGSMIERFKS